MDPDKEHEALHEMYSPVGKMCETGCGHPATDIWEVFLRRQTPRPRSYEFRCACCIAKGKLERAKAARDRIPALEEALATAEKECVGYEAAQLHNHPKGEKE